MKVLNLLPITAILSLFTVTAEAKPVAPISEILAQEYACSDTIVIRSQALTTFQIEQACKLLGKQEAKFHQLFDTQGKPVANDNNISMRANVYHSREDYTQYVTAHFDVPNDNGGMFLEGSPHKAGNQAEFVAYEKKREIWNLAHEYVHYLDGHFNLYGDFCASLHDSHSAPEYCPKPAPLLPHLVWWSEGLGEYISLGDNNKAAIELAKESLATASTYSLSELFNTSYEINGGSDRVYRWGYLAVRFMMEQHKDKIDTMLTFTRKGDYPRYQALIKQWGTDMDANFQAWLNTL
ncbi:collagenase [Shewanella sp. D64]|uniref:collagenase n=1 Tax=unclassified Shewanella TaxID=196818 RepID=UPI0022BA4966|nr:MULTISPECIES: collagenase [unclassified Shewanella]MEC4726456.1 collagenase [Shewanella sp. D64]MEC4738468.1 collagenase [Shewanella sp. E94]WBJ94131.1 collagenase [Shewanella sp. MTB7]